MAYTLLDGRSYSQTLTKTYQKALERLTQHEIKPKLVVITVGDDDASEVYVKQKQKKAEQIGIQFEWTKLLATAEQEELHEMIEEYNQDATVSGILVQFPLPTHLDEKQVTSRIAVEKDVDGFHPYNIGLIVENRPKLIPCTPKGIMEMLKYYGINVDGKRVTIVGRSQIVGLPLALLMTHANATVSICHTHTHNISEYIQQADLVVAASGDRQAINPDDIQNGTVIVDVSMNRREDGTLTGDIELEDVKEKVSAITPVPGGVGPMTVAMLMEQTIRCACLQHGINPQTILESE